MTIWEAIDTMPEVAFLWEAAKVMLGLAAFCAVVWLGTAMLGHPRR